MHEDAPGLGPQQPWSCTKARQLGVGDERYTWSGADADERQLPALDSARAVEHDVLGHAGKNVLVAVVPVLDGHVV
ncbi:hypothetical protein, partial [Streptomyces alkaliterrae]|uniref:hypothetical protein n=1 Tax=Streptomyces alkaliterrae TaxID=2213162 RepID=UPI001E51BEBB